MRATRLLLGLIAIPLVASAPAFAGGGAAAAPKLRGHEEVPALSNPNGGSFTATISADETEVAWTLTYTVPEGSVTQAHLHFGQRSVNGGIMVFLCSNLGNGPAGTQACPIHDGTISGTFHAADVGAGAAAQGVGAGELFSVIRGIKLGVVYANIHTDQFPGGAVRQQLTFTASSAASASSEEE